MLARWAATPVVLLRTSEDTRPVASADEDTLSRTVARLKSGDLDERLAALEVLDRLAQQYIAKVPAIFDALAEFVRDRRRRPVTHAVPAAA